MQLINKEDWYPAWSIRACSECRYLAFEVNIMPPTILECMI